ncbi:MAG: hypothetical protein SCALA702_05300 [Melioribacteraceae bacterium]|nr:MAG: hypothetical protein SCALA702_05300 [Melioribacteraceae bacterium]
MNWLKNQKIGVRLGIGFAVALVGLLVSVFLGINSLGSLNQDVEDLAHDKFPKTVWANNIIDAIYDASRATRNIMLAKDASVIQQQRDRLASATVLFEENFANLERTIKSERGIKLINELVRVRKEVYYPVRTRMYQYIDSGNIDEATTILFGEMREAQNKYFGAITALIDYQNELVNAAAEHADETYSSAQTNLWLLGIFVFLFVSMFGWFITKGITQPIEIVGDRVAQLERVCITNLGNGLLAMSRGDLNAKVEKATKHLNFEMKDEIGDMAQTVDNMITKAQGGIDAYEEVRARIGELSKEADKLINDAKEGKLDNRGNDSKFLGSYKDIIKGFNDVLDAVILPVQDGAKALETMATGDLSVRVTADYKGQHAKIKNSINQLGDSLENLVVQLTDAVEATASASAQISSSSEEMAAGAQEQSVQSNEVASAVEQMTTTILQTTKNAGGAADNAKNAGGIAKSGGQVVEKTIHGMIRIAEVVNSAAEIVEKLGKNSDQIGEIIQVIDEIADQTNLLALNAAIEAARAGEHGRGFAVVADEVRKLAERTTKATKEIASMIKQIQTDTTGAVTSIKVGNEEVDKGRSLAQEAGSSLEEIITASEKVVDDITQVATASEEQSSTAEQISKSIEGISSVTHQNASTTQQIARAAEDLNNLTVNLQEIISRFKVSNGKKQKGSLSGYEVRENGHLLGA